MDNRRKVMIAILIIGIPLFIWIQFFEVPSKVKIGEEKLQQDAITHEFEKVTQFESLYMGDASNVINLLNELPLNQYIGTIELDSDALSLLVNYDINSTEIERQAQQGMIYNSTAMFALIENLQQINMKFNDKTYNVSRDRVEKWFGTTLVDFKDPEVFREKVQSQLNEDLTAWFLAYTEEE
ncbi:DUF4825 domain-containing protein [Sporosarcina ureilytica]|uniref:DUF4825 domain-containing protein n=1 Tax=Sporosarcina ureilytica TaxID=298596 RepID=A0A1D8JER5_9BACL|nr:DUF4825 domain-containing protein [Sporosarcina ureilytica]AOV07178.1 hypothetical protein BI350_06240 [Sporosarcina ureilytica]